jgi:hypothetical protein
MAWVRIDDLAPDHPKLLKAGLAATGFWLRALAYCSRQLTDGFVPNEAAELMGKGQGAKLAQRLVEVGLWDRAEGGYQVHDYHDYQPSREQIRARRERIKARVDGWRHTRGYSNGNANVTPLQSGYSDDCNAAPVPVPVPVPVPQVRTRAARSARAPEAEPDGFAAFWEAYPCHKGKAKALVAYRALAPDAALQSRMLEAISVQSQSDQWKRDGGNFVPHPTTWLHGRRWEDEVSVRPVRGAAPVYAESWCLHDPRCASPDAHALVLAREQKANLAF